MLFLLGVVFIAFRFGRGPSVLAAVLNVAAFDFFFVPPRFTFAVSDVQYLVTFGVMLIVGLVTGYLTAGLRYQAQVGRSGTERARNLYEMAKTLSSTLTEGQVVEISDQFVRSSFGVKAATLLPDESGTLRAPTAHADTPEVDLAVAQWCCDKNEPAGAGTDTLPANARFYLPLKAPMRVRGVLVVEARNPRLLLIPEQRRLLETVAALTAIALERIHFVSVAQETLIKMETERLRNSLLAALSHDLRTPLTALAGSTETLSLELAAAGAPHSVQARTVLEQVLRISRLVSNLLDMARLESGEMKLRKDWQSLEEMVGAALKELDPVIGERRVEVDLASDLPLVRCDAAMIVRVLVNLLDNALKYTPSGTAIGISAGAEPSALRVEVWDEGSGLPPGRERAIFRRLARGDRESAVPGVGLGLAICQSIVEAHGGTIRAENREARGARFVFTLPLDPQPRMVAGLDIDEEASSRCQASS